MCDFRKHVGILEAEDTEFETGGVRAVICQFANSHTSSSPLVLTKSAILPSGQQVILHHCSFLITCRAVNLMIFKCKFLNKRGVTLSAILRLKGPSRCVMIGREGRLS